MNLTKLAFSCLVVALGLGTVGTASADPTSQLVSSNPVGACNVNGGGTPLWDWTGVYNDSTTQNMWLDCSLPAASASVSSLIVSGASMIMGKNRSVSENITCGFKVVTGTGFVVYQDSNQQPFNRTIGPGLDGHMFFSLSGLDLSSPVYASCKIPKKQGASAVSGLTGLWFLTTVWPD